MHAVQRDVETEAPKSSVECHERGTSSVASNWLPGSRNKHRGLMVLCQTHMHLPAAVGAAESRRRDCPCTRQSRSRNVQARFIDARRRDVWKQHQYDPPRSPGARAGGDLIHHMPSPETTDQPANRLAKPLRRCTTATLFTSSGTDASGRWWGIACHWLSKLCHSRSLIGLAAAHRTDSLINATS